MFRFIRKWYFKLYHLFKFLGIFILVFGNINKVIAEEIDITTLEVEECSKINHYKLYGYENNNFRANSGFKIRYKWNYDTNNNILSLNSNDYSLYYSKLIKLKPNTTYVSLTTETIRHYIYLFDANYNYVNLIYNTWTKTLEFTTPNETNYYYVLPYYQRTKVINGNTLIATLYEKNIEAENYYYWETTTCPSLEPPAPEPEENVYSNFLTLYTDKLSYLANGFTENPYLLAMIGIIFAWIVLELFLKILHLKGGKYK